MSDLHAAIDDLLKHDEIMIALDRDGTLVPYANRPEEARVSDDLRRLISDLCARRGVTVAVVSARSAAQLKGDFDGTGAVLAGNYGMEVQLPDGTECIQPYALHAVPDLKTVRDELSEMIDLSNGSILEDHGYSLCLHWHNVPLSHREEVHNAVLVAADNHADLKFRRLPTSYEVLPNIPWDKGMGLAFIDSSTASGATNVSRGRFFAGDTESDTPGFEYVNDRAGISVRIGGNGELLRARYWLATPAELHAILAYLLSHREPHVNRTPV